MQALGDACSLVGFLGKASGAATFSATELGGGKASVGAFPDEVALVLGEGPEQLEEERAGRGAGVYVFGEGTEGDALGLEALH